LTTFANAELQTPAMAQIKNTCLPLSGNVFFILSLMFFQLVAIGELLGKAPTIV